MWTSCVKAPQASNAAAAAHFQFEMSDGEMEGPNNIDGVPTGERGGGGDKNCTAATADCSASVPSAGE